MTTLTALAKDLKKHPPQPTDGLYERAWVTIRATLDSIKDCNQLKTHT